jgi:plasmid stabilization system protein ParE
MQSGYRLFWSDRAFEELQNIIDYLNEKWTQREIRNFVKRLDKRLDLIVANPKLFPKTARRKNIRRSVLTKNTVIYYEVTETAVT